MTQRTSDVSGRELFWIVVAAASFIVAFVGLIEVLRWGILWLVRELVRASGA